METGCYKIGRNAVQMYGSLWDGRPLGGIATIESSGAEKRVCGSTWAWRDKAEVTVEGRGGPRWAIEWVG